MKTIAQQINWDFETNGDLRIRDKNGNLIYYEASSGFWYKKEYDSKGNEICFRANGVWVKREYDSYGNQIYHENSDGFWRKSEFDSKGNLIYYEDSDGKVIDNRPKPCQGKVVEIDGIKYKLVKL